MKNLLGNIFRFIVGSEAGFNGEGNEQWFYFLYLSINLMLIWWLKPEIFLIFTIISVIHYATIFIYGFFDFDWQNAIYSYIFLGIHIILLLVAIFTQYFPTDVVKK